MLLAAYLDLWLAWFYMWPICLDGQELEAHVQRCGEDHDLPKAPVTYCTVEPPRNGAAEHRRVVGQSQSCLRALHGKVVAGLRQLECGREPHHGAASRTNRIAGKQSAKVDQFERVAQVLSVDLKADLDFFVLVDIDAQ